MVVVAREAMSLGRWRQAEGVFSDRDRAVLAYVDEMTLQVHVQVHEARRSTGGG